MAPSKRLVTNSEDGVIVNNLRGKVGTIQSLADLLFVAAQGFASSQTREAAVPAPFRRTALLLTSRYRGQQDAQPALIPVEQPQA
jgi:hypothetical protein